MTIPSPPDSVTQPHLFRLGITGTIGSGKSTVGKRLTELGVAVLDTDHVVQTLYQTDRPMIDELVSCFGPDICNEQGGIDKRKLGPLLFNKPDVKALVESIVHPRVRAITQTFLTDVNALTSSLAQFVLGGSPETLKRGWIRAALVPLLFEAGSESLYDERWAVVTPLEHLIPRLMARNQLTQAEAENRLSRQWTQEEKAQRADRVMQNSGSIDQLNHQIDEAIADIERRYQPLGTAS